MSEAEVVAKTSEPLTRTSLVAELARIGLEPGQMVVVHSSLSRLGWVCGGAVAVIEALLEVLSSTGTLVMPSHSGENTDPSLWQHPPVPESWWPTIRAQMPAFDPEKTPTRGVGVIAETFRRWPGVRRSHHPVASFAALGPQAEYLTSEQSLEDEYGPRSPLGKLYEMDGHVLLLGVDHGNNSSLHVAETRAVYPGKTDHQEASAVRVNGQRLWLSYRCLKFDSDDFAELGKQYETEMGIKTHRIGLAETHLLKQRPLLDWAVGWLERTRGRHV
jgi:aminoglycoside 3-N-acetyltransferase